MKKNIFSIFVCALCLALTSVVFSSCEDAALAAAVKEANKDCPEELAPGMEMTSISLDGKYVVYDYTISDEMYGLLKNQTKTMKRGSITALKAQYKTDDNLKEFIDLVKKSDKDIKCVYTSDSGESFDYVIKGSQL